MPENQNPDNHVEQTNSYQYNPNRPQNDPNDHSNTQKVVDTAAKGAAEVMAPGVGGMAYDALKKAPVVGGAIDRATNDMAQKVDQVPGVSSLAKGLNDSGITDAANQAIDLVGSKGANAGAATGANDLAKGAGNAGKKVGSNPASTTVSDGATPITPMRKNTMFQSMMQNDDLGDREEETPDDENLDDGSTNTTNTLPPSDLPTDDLEESNEEDDSNNQGNTSDLVGQGLQKIWKKYKIPILLIGGGIALFVLLFLVIIGSGSGNSSNNASLLSTYISCETITIINPDGTEETLNFEDYVAGVVTAESGRSDFPEASKAQAVIARTYAIKNTNYCTTPIENSTARQVYTEPSDFAREVTEATKGIILVDENDPTNLLSTYFASYPQEGYNAFPAFPACSQVDCTSDSCTTTMYQIGPNNEYQAFQFTMDRYNNGSTWNGADLQHQTGHCYGLSQVGARYLDQSGYTYEEILETFYYGYSLASMLSGNGLSSMLTSLDWYEMRTARYGITDLTYWLGSNIFYTSSSSLLGQCTWYAHGRAKEILASALENGVIDEEYYSAALSILNRLNRNANMWWDINRSLGSSGFSFSSDTPKIGSLIVFDGVSTASVNGNYCGQYYSAGHVGIVENVYYDENGDWTGLWISDGWKGSSCEDTACFQSRYWSREEVLNYRNGCRPLLGFIYLFDYEV